MIKRCDGRPNGMRVRPLRGAVTLSPSEREKHRGIYLIILKKGKRKAFV